MTYHEGPIIDITHGLPDPDDLKELQRQGWREYVERNFCDSAVEDGIALGLAGFPNSPMVLTLDDGGRVRKKGALAGYTKSASTKPEVIRRHYAVAERLNPGQVIRPGIRLGKGILVADIDYHGKGAKGFNSIIQNGLTFPDFADTAMSCHTYGGGFHVYMRDARGTARTVNNLFPGIDIKASGFVVAYPNLTIMKLEELAAAPDWCYPQNPITSLGTGNSQQLAVGTGEIIPEGNRNCTLYFDYACPLARNGATLQEVLERLREVNAALCRPPVPESELVDIATSAAKKRSKGTWDPDLLERWWLRVDAIKNDSDRAVLVAFMTVAVECHRTADIGVSVRRLANMTGFSMKTAARAVDRLMNSGILAKTKDHKWRGSDSTAARYDLRPPKT